jgi:NADH dehydrogenase [ubiquinone] 1 alpha subcomplex assembly factor 7
MSCFQFRVRCWNRSIARRSCVDGAKYLPTILSHQHIQYRLAANSSKSIVIENESRLIKSDLSSHKDFLRSRYADPMTLKEKESDLKLGVIKADLTEKLIDFRTMYDPNIHGASVPINWDGYEMNTPLTQFIMENLLVRGKAMTIADYMRHALTHEEHGYYTNPSYIALEEEDENWDRDSWDESNIPPSEKDTSGLIIGKHGDFVTAPEVSQLFGECLAVWFIIQHDHLRSPKKIRFVEVGPGKGTLIQDIIRSLCTSFQDRIGSSIAEIHLVERSNAMKQAQRQKLESLELPHTKIIFRNDNEQSKTSTMDLKQSSKIDRSMDGKTNTNESINHEKSRHENSNQFESNTNEKLHTVSVYWHSTFSDFMIATTDEKIPTFVIAQEFIDALPIHVFENTDDGWRERMVDFAINDPDDKTPPQSLPASGKKTRLRVVLSPDVSPACKTLLNIDPTTGKLDNSDIPSGKVIEVCPEGIFLAQDIAQVIKRNGGAGLIIDYGQEGSSDSLRGFSRHQQVSFLSYPGKVDITADVDFAALRHAVNHIVDDVRSEESVFAFGPITQGHFLASMGIVERVTHLLNDESTTDDEAELLVSGMKRLMALDQMGERYKVLAIARKRDGIFVPPGFG